MDNNIKKVVIDSSAIINYAKKLEEMRELYKFIVPTTVVDELDNMKESDSPRRKFMGRTGLKFLENNENYIEYIVTDKVKEETLPEDFDKNLNDNKIISCAVANDSLIATQDRGMKIKANSLNIEILELENDDENAYLGYKILNLDLTIENDEIIMASIYDGTFNKYKMAENEYLIIKDLSNPEYELSDGEEKFVRYKTVEIVRYSKGELLQLKLPPKKYVHPMNDLQKCALDLLNNDEIPIKVIAGGFGSGKTYLSTKMAVYKVVEKGDYGSILVLRNPSVEGEAIGFLPGDKNEKTSVFFTPFTQHLKDGEFEAERLERNGQLKKEIIGYIKGLSIGSTFIIVDEAEDLNLKQLKMCGSRIEENSSICFLGDYRQTHDKFIYSSGLLELIENIKYSEHSGVIILDEDLRSPASKVFADM